MMSAIDTNVISALWSREPASGLAQTLLTDAQKQGGLVICGGVYAELLAIPRVSAAIVDSFLSDTGIVLDAKFDEPMWREAGQRYAKYVQRRRVSGGDKPRRILADFLIGVHALRRADRLLTFNEGDFRVSFPELVVFGLRN